MAARLKAFGFSYAAVVGTVPSSSGGPDITTDPSVADEENNPPGAVRNGYAFAIKSCCLRRGPPDLLTRWYAERYQPEFISGCASDCGYGDSESIKL
jgi:hypothetical protein